MLLELIQRFVQLLKVVTFPTLSKDAFRNNRFLFRLPFKIHLSPDPFLGNRGDHLVRAHSQLLHHNSAGSADSKSIDPQRLPLESDILMP